MYIVFLPLQKSPKNDLTDNGLRDYVIHIFTVIVKNEQ